MPPAIPSASVTIQAPGGGEFQAYLALPPGGSGPGIVVIQEIFGVNEVMRGIADWYAAHGFVALCPDLFWRQEPGVQLTDRTEAGWQRAFELYQGLDEGQAVADTGAALAFLRAHPACSGKAGAVGFCLGGKLAYLLAARHDPDCAAGYYGVGIESSLDEAGHLHGPLMLHLAGQDQFCSPEAQAQIQAALAGNPLVTLHRYPDQDHAFARPGGAHYDAAAAELADLRTLEFCLRHLRPEGAARLTPARQFLSNLWEEHVRDEFVTRDTGATMDTMVDDAYVNHIPTMTGGVGKAQLQDFYARRFIPQMPPDTSMTPLSRTIGTDHLVDEMVFRFTHTIAMDWMLPGIPPTNKPVEIPLVAIVHFRDGKLAHEHIYWDQASVLVQLGLLDPEFLPVAGVETARKALDPSLPSNTLITRAEQEGK
jgi:carboxymethylenebutenolidase